MSDKEVPQMKTPCLFVQPDSKWTITYDVDKANGWAAQGLNVSPLIEYKEYYQLFVDNQRLQKEVADRGNMFMGVGTGNGDTSLFVYGNYDSIKAAQAIVLFKESMVLKAASLRKHANPIFVRFGDWFLSGSMPKHDPVPDGVKPMTDDDFKLIMEKLGMENSLSLLQALKQVQNHTAQACLSSISSAALAATTSVNNLKE